MVFVDHADSKYLVPVTTRNIDEAALLGMPVLTYTPNTGIADLLIANADCPASKTNSMPDTFYAISPPRDGQVTRTQPFELGGVSYTGILYVENSPLGRTYTMNLGMQGHHPSITTIQLLLKSGNRLGGI